MRILLVSMLDVWSLGSHRGAPTFFQTVNALAERHQVDLICTRWSDMPNPDIGPSVRTTRVDPFPLIIRKARAAFRSARIRTNLRPARSHSSEALVSTSPAPRPHTSATNGGSARGRSFYVPGGPANLAELIKLKVEWAAFQARLTVELARRWHEPYDLVYGYEVHAFPGAAVFARARGIPYVARFQGTTLDTTLDRPLLRAAQFEHELAFRAGGDLVIMTNDGTRGDRVLRRLGVPDSRIRFWRNGVDHPPQDRSGKRNAQRASLGIQPNAPVLLSVGRLVYWKRVDRSLELVDRLRKMVPGVVLLVVGDGTDRARLEALAADFELTPSVRFLGAVDRDHLGDLYAAADLFLSFNDLSNAANPVFEAMANGLPVLTLDTGDTSDVVTERTGVALPRWDPQLAAEAAYRLLGDVDARSRMASAGRAWAQAELWDWAERMDAELEQLDRLVAK